MKRILLSIILRFHNLCYRYAASLAIRIEGKHPKHRLMRYKEWFLDHLEPDDIVLDIGCNTGGMLGLFSSKATFIYGIEIDKRLIDKANEDYSAPNVECIHADATLLDYSALRPISVVTLSNVLEHIDKRVEFLRAIVTRVNWRNPSERRLLIRVPMIDRDWITLYKKELGIEWRLDPTHFTEYTQRQFNEELTAANIVIENIEIRFGEVYAVCIAQ